MMKVFGIRALALLWLIMATYARPQIGVDDPNALRASRLLYSPRNGPDMRTILRRYCIVLCVYTQKSCYIWIQCILIDCLREQIEGEPAAGADERPLGSG